MTYNRSDTILCLDNFKEGALYFDRVLPLNMGRMRGDPDVGDIMIGYPEELPSAVLSHLIDQVEGNTSNYCHADRVMGLITKHWTDFAKNVHPYANLYAGGPNNEVQVDPIEEHLKFKRAYLSD